MKSVNNSKEINSFNLRRKKAKYPIYYGYLHKVTEYYYTVVLINKTFQEFKFD